MKIEVTLSQDEVMQAVKEYLENVGIAGQVSRKYWYQEEFVVEVNE